MTRKTGICCVSESIRTVQKNVLSILVASAVMAMASAASAEVLSINLQGANVGQLQNGNVTQRALSAAAAVGNTGNNVDVSSTAASIGQNASMDLGVSQDASFLDANLLSSGIGQTVNGVVDQASASIAGTGNLGANSSISSTAANIGQSASMTVRVRQ